MRKVRVSPSLNISRLELMFVALLVISLCTGCAPRGGAKTNESVQTAQESKSADTAPKQEAQTDKSSPCEIALTWGKPEVVTGDVKFGHGISPDGRAATMIFDNLILDLNPTDSALDATTFMKLRFPLTLPSGKRAGLFGFRPVIRGHIQKPTNVKINLITELAGNFTVFEFPYGIEFSDDFSRTSFSYMEIHAIEPSQEGGELKYPDIPPLTVTFIISIQRLSRDAGVLVNIDSLDWEVIFNACSPRSS